MKSIMRFERNEVLGTKEPARTEPTVYYFVNIIVQAIRNYRSSVVSLGKWTTIHTWV
jgi:hypothetical protein